MFREGHTPTDEPHALSFEQPPLEAAKGFAHRDSTACRHNAVPGNVLPPRASGHGVAGGTRTARQPRDAGQLSVSDHAALWHTLNQFIELVPGGRHDAKR